MYNGGGDSTAFHDGVTVPVVLRASLGQQRKNDRTETHGPYGHVHSLRAPLSPGLHIIVAKVDMQLLNKRELTRVFLAPL